MSKSTVGDAAIAVVRRNTEEVQGKGIVVRHLSPLEPSERFSDGLRELLLSGKFTRVGGGDLC